MLLNSSAQSSADCVISPAVSRLEAKAIIPQRDGRP
jgi:hypothetical protein